MADLDMLMGGEKGAGEKQCDGEVRVCCDFVACRHPPPRPRRNCAPAARVATRS